MHRYMLHKTWFISGLYCRCYQFTSGYYHLWYYFCYWFILDYFLILIFIIDQGSKFIYIIIDIHLSVASSMIKSLSVKLMVDYDHIGSWPYVAFVHVESCPYRDITLHHFICGFSLWWTRQYERHNILAILGLTKKHCRLINTFLSAFNILVTTL